MLSLAVVKSAVLVAGLTGLAIGAFFQGAGHGFPEPRLRHIELPQSRLLLVAEREVTRRDWQACADAGACEALQGDVTNSGPDEPMTGVNHLDAEAYIAWANANSALQYRLPSAEEWRIIAAELPRKPKKKLFDDPRLAWAADYGSMETVSGVVRPSGAFGNLPNGIADLGGNVWEWTSTCTLTGADASHCPAYLTEGLHETAISVFVRDPASGGCAMGAPAANIGFRLVAEE